MTGNEDGQDDPAAADRRSFLLKAGRFAAVVPPTMTVLLSTTMNSAAIAASSAGTSPVSRRGAAGVPPAAVNPIPDIGRAAAQNAAPVAAEPPVIGAVPLSAGPAGGSLVAGSPDFNPAPFVAGPPSSKVAGAGERG